MLASLQRVTKTYPSGDGIISILTDCDLKVAPKETVAITGPSGSGKSTLLNLFGGLDQPDYGEVTVAGHHLAKLDATSLARFRNSEVGFIFQLHHLLPHCTAMENILVPTLAAHHSPAQRKELEDRARMLLDAVGLTHRATHRPGQLSGGERQRAAIARALILSPKLLLADEPTGALDAANAAQLADLLASLNDREGVAIVMVTHAPELAARMQRVLLLHNGKLIPRPA